VCHSIRAEKRRTFDGATQQLETGKTDLEGLASEEQKLASDYREGLTFQQMIVELKGMSKISGQSRSLRPSYRRLFRTSVI
jgi:hypothetical protein